MKPIRLEHVPRWILAIGLIGTPITGLTSGPLGAVGFALGTAGSWWNYRYLQQALASLAKAAVEGTSPGSARVMAGLFARFFVLAAGSIVILKYSKISLIALLIGLFTPCFAICLEILYELLWSTSTKSG